MTYPSAQNTTNGALEEQTVPEKHRENIYPISGLPANFGEVVKGIYRSSFPQPCNLPALTALGLKTIVTFVEEPYTQSHADFLKENGIAHHRIILQANKDPAVKTPDHTMNCVLEILLNEANHPILIHCNKGKHRTGCVTGCFRKLQGWDMSDIISEYFKYSFPKSRVLDEKFIESFDPSELSQLAQISGAKSWQSSETPKFQGNLDEQLPNRPLQPPLNGIRVS